MCELSVEAVALAKPQYLPFIWYWPKGATQGVEASLCPPGTQAGHQGHSAARPSIERPPGGSGNTSGPSVRK